MAKLTRPSITEVIGRYVDLKRAGKEWRGLCPLHNEKSPSFYVNEEKGVFHCFGCGEHGDVITFIQKIEQVDFKGALAHLGLDDAVMPGRRSKGQPSRQAASTIAEWAQEMAKQVGGRMCEVGQRVYIARKARTTPGTDKSFLDDEISRCGREWFFLEAIQEDLFNPTLVIELWSERESLGEIINGSRAIRIRTV